MNFLQLRTLVVNWLDDVNFGYFTQDNVNVWLNNGYREVQKRLIKAGSNYYTIIKTTPTVANQRRYNLPEDLKKINRLEVITNTTPMPNENFVQISPITVNQVDLVVSGVGQPQYYFIDKNTLMLWPTPQSVQTLRLMYSYNVTDMVNDLDIPDVPDPYHELISLLACEDGFLKDGRMNDLLSKKITEFDAMLYADSTDRQQDVVRTVVSTGEDFNGGVYW